MLAATVSPAAAAVAQSHAKAKPAPAMADMRLERSATAIDEGRFGAALELVQEAVTGGKLSTNDEDWASYLTARALAGIGKGDDAEATVKARFKDHPNGYTWASLVAIATTLGRHEQAANAILDLEEEQFIWVNRLRPALVESIVAALDGPAGDVRDRLIVRLVEGRYAGPASQRVPDTLRLRYINLLLRQRRVEDAARQTQAVETPAILSILLTDKSFEPLWQHSTIRALWAPGALVARVERGVQLRLEQPMLSSSDWLSVMRALRIIGRADEAVRLGLHAVEQARKEKRAAGAALRLEIANAYVDMGEAWAARRTARQLLREEPSAPVSLRVGIAQVLENSGDDDGALVLLGTIQGLARTPAVLKLTACAAHDLGREQKRDAALAELEPMVETAPGDLFEALVCTGQKTRAGAVLKLMLERPELRASAILTAQLYADPAKPIGDRNDMRYRMTALVASAEVQSAIMPYARSMGLPFTMANAGIN
jgi:tetratricopeptide (TPR) repeat protein